MIKEGIISQS